MVDRSIHEIYVSSAIFTEVNGVMSSAQICDDHFNRSISYSQKFILRKLWKKRASTVYFLLSQHLRLWDYRVNHSIHIGTGLT